VNNNSRKENSIIRRLVFRTVFVVVLMCSWLILTAGAFSDAVKLKNAGKPFVDLDSTIVTGDTGKGGNAGLDIETDETEGSDADLDKEIKLAVEISEEKIKLDDEEMVFNRFKNELAGQYKEGITVILIDNYAEYHTYKKVKAYLEEKKIKFEEERK